MSALTLWMVGVQPARADLIELLSGAKVEGTVTKIDKAAKEVTLTRDVGGRAYQRTYPYDKIHAVTMSGQRYVLTEKTPARTGCCAGQAWRGCSGQVQWLRSG